MDSGATFPVFGLLGVPGRSVGLLAETFRVERRMDLSPEKVGSLDEKDGFGVGADASAGVGCGLMVVEAC